MPVSHRFSRRAAAIGAALALAALPISATFTPAFAQPSPTPTAEASSNAEAGASVGADSDSGDDAGSTADSTDGADADSSSADNGVTEVEAAKEGDTDPDPDEDGACADSDQGTLLPSIDQPCAIDNELKASWDSDTKQLSVKPNDNRPGSLPKSWEGVKFDGPTDRGMVRVPAQDASSGNTAATTGSNSDTDDSGRSVADATTQADAPTQFEFGSDGTIRAAGEEEAFKFESFGDKGPNPEWTFKADGKNITASGQQYSDDEGTANDSGVPDGTSNDGSTADTEQDGTADSDPSASADGSDSSDGATADSDPDGGKTASKDGATTDDGSGSDREAGKDGSSSASEASDDSTTSTDGGSSSDSGSKDRANTSGDKDSDGGESDADTGSGSDGSRGSDSDRSGSDSDSGDDDEKESDKDGSGSSIGASDADGTTPDPSNGNGSPDDERETIPGNAGDEWLPGDDEDTETPDYSDPVPRNPDEPAPKDDTDLITGGDQPSPRANQNPATSFGESIISTIVSSWPIFVLAASGMAAVGFIIYLMGRRGKQE